MDISYIVVLFQFLLYITIYCCSVSVPGIFVMFQCLLYICTSMYVYTIHMYIVVLFQCRLYIQYCTSIYIYRYLYCCYVSVPVIHTVYMYLYCCSVSVPVLRVSESYVGTVSEKGGQVEVDPPIRADNGPICGYRVSATRSPNIPFEVIYL